MTLTRRAALTGLTSVAALAVSGCGLAGGPYPSRSIEMTVGFGAGGFNDTVSRRFAQALERELAGNVLVVNRPGGGGIIAATEARTARPDGYHLLMASLGAFAASPLMQDVGYAVDDFVSLAGVSQNYFTVAVSRDSPIRSMDDLFSLTGSRSFATFGTGNPTHIIGALAARHGGFQGRPVPFDNTAEGMLSVANQEVDFGVLELSTVRPMVERGTLRLLAVADRERVEAYPDVPTTLEAGLPDSVYTGSQGLVVRRDAPAEVVALLTDAAARALGSPDYTAFLEQNSLTVPESQGEAYFAEYVRNEQERYRRVFEELDIRSSRR